MLKVYVTGLIYFDGCDAAQRHMYAPDGRQWEVPHQASLWIEEEEVNQSATHWWPSMSFAHQVKAHGQNDPPRNVIEFRIPNLATIWFPDAQDAVWPCNLENDLPKLKRNIPNGSQQNFTVDPSNAQTIAEVTIRGGEIHARRFKNLGLVEWTIHNHSALQITAVLNAGGEPRTITLNTPANGDPAEVLFANLHEVSGNADGDGNGGDHTAVFAKLNPAVVGSTVVSVKASGNVGQLANAKSTLLKHLKEIGYSDGETPPCCYN